MLKSALAFAAQLLWPARCAGCDQLVPPQLDFCHTCQPSLLPLLAECPRCALPILGVEGHCRRCLSDPFPFTRARSVWAYGGAVSDAILRFKHGGRPDLARPLGRGFVPVLTRALAGADAILPVPLHPRRLRARGFNQALELLRAARGVAGGAGWPPLWVNTLRRIRDTPALGRFSPRERRQAIAGAFAVSTPARVRGCRLLVVDDVMTTGATLAACTRVLLEAGAVEVGVAALARAI
jgi:ComF family protein